MTYTLGILDQSPIFPEKSAREALESSIHLAKKAEQWGYERFWLAEHHQSDDVAGSSPEILMAHLIAQTKRIKIGSGGVMLQHYSPYKVAENFHLMAALAPNRVELGIGKAPGGLSASTKALKYGGTGSVATFEERFTLLQHFIHDNVPSTHALYGAKAYPEIAETVPTFLLGASVESAKLAANAQANFVFASFLNGDDVLLQEAINAYRNIHSTGKFILAVGAFAADTQAEAEEEASVHKIFMARFASGRTLKLASLEQVEKLRAQSEENFEVAEQEIKMLAGTKSFIKAELDRLAATFAIDDFILHTPIEDEAKRLKSFELLGIFNKRFASVH